MKKFILCFLVVCILFTCGCMEENQRTASSEINYTTKYISNCEWADFYKEPAAGSEVICKIKCGDAVSFEKNVENGYSKIAHGGTTGYVLAVYLDTQKPAGETKAKKESKQSPDTVAVPKEDFAQTGYGDLISHANEGDIEKYISGYVRPTYNSINKNIESFKKEAVGEYTKWYNNAGICVKKEVPMSLGGGVSRQYYFNEETGKLIFAFVFKGTHEYRLYFKDDKLIRTIDDMDNLVNNPTFTEDLELAWASVNEAYYP